MNTYLIFFFAVSMSTFMSYFLFVYWRCGWQPSLSESFYAIEKRYGDWKWIFTLALWAFAFPLGVVGVEVNGGFWFAASFTMLVGAAPAFKSKGMVRSVHIIGATSGISIAILSFLLSPQPVWGIAIIVAIVAFMLLKIKNKTLWIETAAFIITWIGLFSIHATVLI